MAKELKLTIGWFYPDLMNTYGDYGNVAVLETRAIWARIEVEVRAIDAGSQLEKDKHVDLMFMGGAQDRQQASVSQDLVSNKGSLLKDLIEADVPGLFICGAYQLLGNSYIAADSSSIDGLKIFDIETKSPSATTPRLIGDIVIKSDLSPESIVGFENHGGRTILGNRAKPFGHVLSGQGNNGTDGTEGTIYRRSIGSYLHGPILPINPKIADWLITKALETKYGQPISLTFPDDTIEAMIRQKIISKKRA